MTYSEKLRDQRWIDFRDRFLRNVSVETDYGFLPQCDNCGHWPDKQVQVHHKRYIEGREPWEYEYKDLRVLCRECHKYIHKVEWTVRAFILSLTIEECDGVNALFEDLELCKRQDNLRQALSYATHSVRDLYHEYEYRRDHPNEPAKIFSMADLARQFLARHEEEIK